MSIVKKGQKINHTTGFEVDVPVISAARQPTVSLFLSETKYQFLIITLPSIDKNSKKLLSFAHELGVVFFYYYEFADRIMHCQDGKYHDWWWIEEYYSSIVGWLWNGCISIQIKSKKSISILLQNQICFFFLHFIGHTFSIIIRHWHGIIIIIEIGKMKSKTTKTIITTTTTTTVKTRHRIRTSILFVFHLSG